MHLPSFIKASVKQAVESSQLDILRTLIDANADVTDPSYMVAQN